MAARRAVKVVGSWLFSPASECTELMRLQRLLSLTKRNAVIWQKGLLMRVIFQAVQRNSVWVDCAQAHGSSMPSVLKTYYVKPLINLLACEAWHSRAIHHEQEIDTLSADGVSKGYQLSFLRERKGGRVNLFDFLQLL